MAVPHLAQPRPIGRRSRGARRAPEHDVDERFDRTGAWISPPEPWADRADDRVVAQHLAERVQDLLPQLPESQRQVVVLRDLEGLPADDVAALVGITDGNQRVLLHRGRAQLRQLLSAQAGVL